MTSQTMHKMSENNNKKMPHKLFKIIKFLVYKRVDLKEQTELINGNGIFYTFET